MFHFYSQEVYSRNSETKNRRENWQKRKRIISNFGTIVNCISFTFRKENYSLKEREF